MFLCVDTISKTAGITISDSGSATYFPLDPMQSSEGIIGTIDEALKRTEASLNDLEAVLVIKGPGSFTGLRVGISVTNQFAHQLKIPIFGLRTDEWWLARSSGKATYLQSMNKAEVYQSDGQDTSILKLTELKPCRWLGQLSPEHREMLSEEFKEISDLESIEGTWQKVVARLTKKDAPRRTYELVEPFYGKVPNITVSKKKSEPVISSV